VDVVSAAYDLVVIGAGSAGLAGAGFARRLRLRVALVEAHRVGGDCTWTGCVPSKALLHAAAAAHAARTGGRTGVPGCDLAVDLSTVMATVHAARERVYALETPEELARQGIDVLLGPTAFRDPRTLVVGDGAVTARRVLLCTGASPAVPPVPGLADGPYLTNQNVFELTRLPEHLVVLGGGPVGVELAQAFRRLGARVTLLGRNPRVLPPADEEASAVLAAALQDEGIAVFTGARVERVERAERTCVVARIGAGAQEIECDQILVAAGRRPNVGGLGLDRAGVEVGEKGVRVDEKLRTSQPRVYAAGDVTGGFQFTHYAGWQAVRAVRNMFLPGSSRAVLPSVPWAVFTDPEVAQVGLTEREARGRGETHEVRRLPLARNDRAQIDGERRGLMKCVLGPNGRILGATIVGTAASELINEVSLAMDNKVPFHKLCQTIHVYPSYGFTLELASADALYDRLNRGAPGLALRALARLVR
jgi:pyruvate/2-oxoglutarate dehydrogenase complex dihydrolipoamide dehydrogenase (E3) component